MDFLFVFLPIFLLNEMIKLEFALNISIANWWRFIFFFFEDVLVKAILKFCTINQLFNTLKYRRSSNASLQYDIAVISPFKDFDIAVMKICFLFLIDYDGK